MVGVRGGEGDGRGISLTYLPENIRYEVIGCFKLPVSLNDIKYDIKTSFLCKKLIVIHLDIHWYRFMARWGVM